MKRLIHIIKTILAFIGYREKENNYLKQCNDESYNMIKDIERLMLKPYWRVILSLPAHR